MIPRFSGRRIQDHVFTGEPNEVFLTTIDALMTGFIPSRTLLPDLKQDETIVPCWQETKKPPFTVSIYHGPAGSSICRLARVSQSRKATAPKAPDTTWIP